MLGSGSGEEVRIPIWFFGIDRLQIAAIVKWLLVTRLLGEFDSVYA